jgi:hypothetical protein
MHATKKYLFGPLGPQRFESYVSMSSLPIEENHVRFEVFTAMTMKNAVFCDVTPCGPCKNRLLVTANIVPNSQILVTLIMDALSSSETSVLTRATQRNIPQDGTLHHNL